MKNVDNPLVTLLVLDFRKPESTRQCLESIKRHMKAAHRVVYLDNGGGQTYPWDLYREGLCDVLISKRDGQGGGIGQTDLFRWCDTPFAIFVQSDQILIHDITTDILNQLIGGLRGDVKCMGLNGDQSGRNVWSDRAHLISTSFFNSLSPFPNGGPGPRHEDRWNENYLQEVFQRPGHQIAHVRPLLFADNGRTTVRETPDGGIVEMATDTKAVTWIKPPSTPYVFPEHTPDEWESVIAGVWPAGAIPNVYLERGQSFSHWNRS